VDGVTGRYVRPHDAVELRSVLGELLDDRALAARLGAAARQWALEHADLDVYARRLADAVEAELRAG
jgi:glycosyltransferase involved in cell wall biosynthesis